MEIYDYTKMPLKSEFNDEILRGKRKCKIILTDEQLQKLFQKSFYIKKDKNGNPIYYCYGLEQEVKSRDIIMEVKENGLVS